MLFYPGSLVTYDIKTLGTFAKATYLTAMWGWPVVSLVKQVFK